MKIASSSAVMFLLSAAATTRNVAAFTPQGLSLTRNYHRSIVSSLNANAEKGGQKQQQKQQGGELDLAQAGETVV